MNRQNRSQRQQWRFRRFTSWFLVAIVLYCGLAVPHIYYRYSLTLEECITLIMNGNDSGGIYVNQRLVSDVLQDHGETAVESLVKAHRITDKTWVERSIENYMIHSLGTFTYTYVVSHGCLDSHSDDNVWIYEVMYWVVMNGDYRDATIIRNLIAMLEHKNNGDYNVWIAELRNRTPAR